MEKNNGIFYFRKLLAGNFLNEKKGRNRLESRLRRSMGMLLAVAVVFNIMSTGSFAAFASESREARLCEHLAEHTQDSGAAYTNKTAESGSPLTDSTTTEWNAENGKVLTDNGETKTMDSTADDTITDGTAQVGISDVAKVEKDGSIIGYVDESGLNAAFGNSDYDGATFTLLKDVEEQDILNIKINCTLDLGRHTIHVTGKDTCVGVYGRAAVTIRGEGEIISDQLHALSVLGNVTLEGGTFTSGKENCAGVYVNSEAAILSVTGEDVVIRNIGGGYGLAVNAVKSVRLSAGTYSGGAGAISVYKYSNNSPTLGGMLANTDNIRYAYFDGGNVTPITGKLGEMILTGTVKVQECNHTGEGVCSYAHIVNTAAHTKNCLACGQTWASEECSYDFSDTTGTCTACGDSVNVAVSGTDRLIYDGTGKKPGVTVTRDGTELAADMDYTVAYTDNTNAGTAKVIVTIGNGQGTYTRNFTIGHATPGITWGSASQQLIYTGDPAAITAPNVMLANNESFSGAISYSCKKQGETDYKNGLPTDAGTYTVRAHIDAEGNYTAADSANELALTIQKADAEITVGTAAYNVNYGDSVFAISGVTDNNPEAAVQYTVSEGADVVSVSDGTVAIRNAGTAVITVSLPETANYNAAENKNITVKVAKASAPSIETQVKQFVSTKGSRGEASVFDVAGKLPADRGKSVYTLISSADGSIYSDAAVDENGKLTYKVGAGSVGGTASIQVTVKMANYEDAVFTLEIKLVDVIQAEITAEAEDAVYDGRQHKGYADGIACDYPVEGFTFAYTGREGTVYDSGEPPVHAGSYTVIISVADKSGDYKGEVFLDFVIGKASVTIKADDKTAEKGSPIPELTYTVSGLAEKDSLAATPEIACSADMKTEGSYPIIVSGAKVADTNNYYEVITYENGTLTVLDSAVHVTGVSLDKSTLSLAVGGTGQLAAVLSPENATDKSVSWDSGNAAVASVDSSGKVTAVSVGTAVITVTTADGGYTASCTVTVRKSTGGSSGSGGSGSSGSGSSGSFSSNISTGSGTGQTSKQPFIKDSSGRKGWDAIRAEAQTAAAAPAGGTVIVDMNGAVSVPGSIFAAVKGKDVTLRFDMGSGITWSVNGRDITAETAGDTDFSVKVDAGAIPEELAAKKAGGLAHLELSLAHEGEFGFTAALTLRIVSKDGNGVGVGSSGMTEQFAGMYANLFYYNPALRSLEFVCMGKVGEDGTVSLPFVHASDYTVILSASPMDGGAGMAENPPAQQKPEENARPKVKSVTLSKTRYTYNGKPKKPSVTAVDTAGGKISAEYYTVSYKNNKKAGKATVTVKFHGGYSGTVKKSFTIRPAGTSIQKLTADSGGFTVKWKKKTAQTSGYQIQYSQNKGFQGNSTHSVFAKKASVTKKEVKNLKAGKKYYVRIRTYKTVKVDGKNKKIYSAWSGAVQARQ